MGRTLFRYLFKDLVRIFVFSAVVIAGIMSFGGLLRPLTLYSLDAAQVMQMWLYLMPAMMSYSLPIAAVFATSMVYGRLTADNELTACRAAGIGYGAICGPAVALGLLSAVLSLIFLSFVVPFFSLQAQKVIYTNAAQLVASEIERTHSFTPPSRAGKTPPTIFARRAIIPPSSGKDGEQTVVIDQPTVIYYGNDPQDPTLKVPRVFALASKATLYVRQGEEGEVQIWAVLEDATRFTRILGSKPQGGFANWTIGPINMPSPLQQNVKFMDIRRLKELAAEPERTSRVRSTMREFIEDEQRHRILTEIVQAAISNREGYTFDTGEQRPLPGTKASQPSAASEFRLGEQHQLIAPGASVRPGEKGGLVLTAGKEPIRVFRNRGSGRTYEAKQAIINADIDNEEGVVDVTLELRDVGIPDPSGQIQKASDFQVYSLPMSPELKAMQKRKLSDYVREDFPPPGPERHLRRQAMVARNEVMAEMHARASFGISCLVLVMVGAVLGMQFRSGDFLTAFSVSVIPAIITITLVVAGTQTAGGVSERTLHNPIWLALCLVWLGNALALIMAIALYSRIRRT